MVSMPVIAVTVVVIVAAAMVAVVVAAIRGRRRRGRGRGRRRRGRWWGFGGWWRWGRLGGLRRCPVVLGAPPVALVLVALTLPAFLLVAVPFGRRRDRRRCDGRRGW